jgi:hypothetical protein
LLVPKDNVSARVTVASLTVASLEVLRLHFVTVQVLWHAFVRRERIANSPPSGKERGKGGPNPGQVASRHSICYISLPISYFLRAKVYSNQVNLTLTANWVPPPQVVVQVYEGGIGTASQQFEQTLIETKTFPWAATMNISVNTGPAPEFPPYAFIGFYVFLLPQGQSLDGLTGPLFRSGMFATTLPTAFPTDPNGMINILELDATNLPISQAQLDTDVAAGFKLPHRLPAQVVVETLSTPIGNGDITIIAQGTWTAPDGASQSFKYVVSVELLPSTQMFPDTSEVVGISTIGDGTISFAPNPDPWFLSVADWAIATIFKPFILGNIAPMLRSTLTARIQGIVISQANKLFGFPPGGSLPAGVVLSLERVLVDPTNGIRVIAALGSFGPLPALPASTGGGLCLLTFLSTAPFTQPVLNLAPYRAIRGQLQTNHSGRCVIRAYYVLSRLAVPWLARHTGLSSAIRKMLVAFPDFAQRGGDHATAVMQLLLRPSPRSTPQNRKTACARCGRD